MGSTDRRTFQPALYSKAGQCGKEERRSPLALSPNNRVCSQLKSSTMLLHYVCLHQLQHICYCHHVNFPMNTQYQVTHTLKVKDSSSFQSELNILVLLTREICSHKNPTTFVELIMFLENTKNMFDLIYSLNSLILHTAFNAIFRYLTVFNTCFYEIRYQNISSFDCQPTSTVLAAYLFQMLQKNNFKPSFQMLLKRGSSSNLLWFHSGFNLSNPIMVFYSAFNCQSAAHAQACYSNCVLLDSCPGHTGGPYGKQENVSLKFNYLPCAYITLCCFI